MYFTVSNLVIMPRIGQKQDPSGTVHKTHQHSWHFWTAQSTLREDRSLKVKVYRKPTHTDLLCDYHHPLEHEHHQDAVAQSRGSRKSNRKALQPCGYTNCKHSSKPQKEDPLTTRKRTTTGWERILSSRIWTC